MTNNGIKLIISALYYLATNGQAEKAIQLFGGAHGVIDIAVGKGHGDTSSNPGRDWLHFT